MLRSGVYNFMKNPPPLLLENQFPSHKLGMLAQCTNENYNFSPEFLEKKRGMEN